MKQFIFSFSLIFTCMLFVSGCDLAQPQNKGQGQPAAPPVEPPQAEVPVPPEDAPTQEAPAQEDRTEMVRAETGVGVRGQSLSPVTANNPADIVVAPVAAMFRTQQRIVFLQVEAAENRFHAMHDRSPASHEEYMQAVIRANSISLPQLPPGQEYFYDAAARELKVKRPR